MLELRLSCECCDVDLPPSATNAMICTFECTFCRDCVDKRLKGVCPKLRRQLCAAAGAAAGKTFEQSAVEEANF